MVATIKKSDENNNRSAIHSQRRLTTYTSLLLLPQILQMLSVVEVYQLIPIENAISCMQLVGLLFVC
jgi:hypothetical protein